MHQYVGPNAPLPTLTRAAVLGEFGGLGLRLEGHQLVPEDSFSYQEMHSPAELEVSLRDTHATLLAGRTTHGQACKRSIQVHTTQLESAPSKKTMLGMRMVEGNLCSLSVCPYWVNFTGM